MTKPEFTTWIEVDAAIAEWQRTLSVIDENLSELDEQEAMVKISGTATRKPVTLTGATATRVQPAIEDLRGVWVHRARLGQIVEEAAIERKKMTWILNEANQMAVINRLLRGPSIILPGTRVPLALRSLVSTGQNDTRLTPDDLLDAMQKSFTVARDLVMEVEKAWDTLLPEIVRKIREIEGLESEATTVAPALVADCADLKIVAETLRTRVMEDPLGTRAGMTTDLDPHIAQIRQQVQIIRDAEGTIFDAQTRARELLRQLNHGNREVAEARAKCIAEIRADIELKSPIDFGRINGMASWLQALDDTAAAGRPLAAIKGFERWFIGAEELLAEIQHLQGVNQGLLARRDEIAGLLKARRAQADSLAAQGLYVSPDAERAYQQAKVLLAHKPCEIALAAGHVHAYDTAVGSLSRASRRP